MSKVSPESEVEFPMELVEVEAELFDIMEEDNHNRANENGPTTDPKTLGDRKSSRSRSREPSANSTISNTDADSRKSSSSISSKNGTSKRKRTVKSQIQGQKRIHHVQGQKSEPKRGSTTTSRKLKKIPEIVTVDPNFSFSHGVKEDHGKPILGVAFHSRLKPGQPIIFAAVGNSRVSIYECKHLTINILQVYQEPDEHEIFCTCDWTSDPEGNALLAAAGNRGVIRILSPHQGTCVQQLLGHCGGVNHLVFHPKDPNLLLSASQDHTLRLWNIATARCVVIFGGVEGHRDVVLTADFSLDGRRIVSGGMDHSMKVWRLDSPEVVGAIEGSYTWQSKVMQNGNVTKVQPFATTIQSFPNYVTREVHGNYVDCVKWFGDFILSKSCENEIICWKGGSIFEPWDEVFATSKNPKQAKTTIIHKWEIEKCDSLWYIRFGLFLDTERKTLAMGNGVGDIFMFDLNNENPFSILPSVLKHAKSSSVVRQTAFSPDGSIVVCVCEDATIWRWDLVNTKQIMSYMNNDIHAGRKIKKRKNGNGNGSGISSGNTLEVQVSVMPILLSEGESD